MTCYMRHLDWLFEGLELESDRDNRRAVDSSLKRVIGLGADAHCPEVWAAVKALSEDERADLVPRVAADLAQPSD